MSAGVVFSKEFSSARTDALIICVKMSARTFSFAWHIKDIIMEVVIQPVKNSGKYLFLRHIFYKCAYARFFLWDSFEL